MWHAYGVRVWWCAYGVRVSGAHAARLALAGVSTVTSTADGAPPTHTHASTILLSRFQIWPLKHSVLLGFGSRFPCADGVPGETLLRDVSARFVRTCVGEAGVGEAPPPPPAVRAVSIFRPGERLAGEHPIARLPDQAQACQPAGTQDDGGAGDNMCILLVRYEGPQLDQDVLVREGILVRNEGPGEAGGAWALDPARVVSRIRTPTKWCARAARLRSGGLTEGASARRAWREGWRVGAEGAAYPWDDSSTVGPSGSPAARRNATVCSAVQRST